MLDYARLLIEHPMYLLILSIIFAMLSIIVAVIETRKLKRRKSPPT